MTNPRRRVAAVAGSMALSMSLVLAPAAMAQDGPEAAVQGFLDAVAAKDFEALPGYFCEAEADQAAQFDIAQATAELSPLVLEPLLESFSLDVQLDILELVSQTDAEAVVHVVGSLEMGLDPEPLMPLIELFIQSTGQEVSDESIDAALREMFGDLETEPSAIETDVRLIPGDDGWLICSELSLVTSGPNSTDDDVSDDMDDDDMSADDTSDDMSDDVDDDDMDDEEDGE